MICHNKDCKFHDEEYNGCIKDIYDEIEINCYGECETQDKLTSKEAKRE